MSVLLCVNRSTNPPSVSGTQDASPDGVMNCALYGSLSFAMLGSRIVASLLEIIGLFELITAASAVRCALVPTTVKRDVGELIPQNVSSR